MAAARPGGEIVAAPVEDYTARRLNSRVGPHRIKECPSCGRKGVRKPYVDGTEGYNHRAEIVTVGKLAFREITDHCFINPARRTA